MIHSSPTCRDCDDTLTPDREASRNPTLCTTCEADYDEMLSDPPSCPACGSPDAIDLGALGQVFHRRCRDCGIASFDAAGDARFDYRDVIRVKEIAAAALAADREKPDEPKEKP